MPHTLHRSPIGHPGRISARPLGAGARFRRCCLIVFRGKRAQARSELQPPSFITTCVWATTTTRWLLATIATAATRPRRSATTGRNGLETSTSVSDLIYTAARATRSTSAKNPYTYTVKTRNPLLSMPLNVSPSTTSRWPSRQIAAYIAKLPYLHLAASCNNALEAQQLLAAQPVDLIFVDIKHARPQRRGVSFRSLTERPMVHLHQRPTRKYAIDGFKLDAVDYLLKPFGFSGIQPGRGQGPIRSTNCGAQPTRSRTGADARSGTQGLGNTYRMKADYKVSLVRIADIVSTSKARANTCGLHLADGTAITSRCFRLKNIGGGAARRQSCARHRSYIVNLRCIKSYVKGVSF